MVLSMTSFARRERETEFGSLRWELRSVNHRYLYVSMRMPEELRVLEPRVREAVAARLNRGKVEAGLRLDVGSGQSREFTVDEDLVKRVVKAMDEVGHMVINPERVSPLELLRWPGVMQQQELDREPLYEAVMQLLEEALDDMLDSRRREGDKLKAVILQRCDAIDALVAQVRDCLPGLREALRTKLVERLGELVEQLDPGRLEQEIALLAQKMDVDEEVDRLSAHVAEVRAILEREEPVGRRLDFLMQELNREANTLASKSVDAEVTRISVDLKVLIEQIREQVQNIE